MKAEDEPHMVFLPYMAPGHMMPLVDTARLFAANGVRITIITTTTNAPRFKTTIGRDAKSGKQIGLEILPFPSTEAGLPQGVENLSSTSTPEMSIKLFKAIDMLQPEIEKRIREIRPACIASDVLFPWTVDLAVELGVPRLAFDGSGFFSLCVSNNVERYQPHKNIDSETEPFVVPGLPDPIELTRSQLPDIVKTRNEFSALFDRLKEAQRKSFGMLVNSFYELEPGYADYYRNIIGIKAWSVGPVSLFNIDSDDRLERGNAKSSASDKHSYLNWLDSQRSHSVIYVCFGSLTRFTKTQLTEISAALEASGHPFIWVVGKLLESSTVEEAEGRRKWWLPQGFEERMKENGKGLIVKGWAPQVLILEHPSTGGMLTHCGWNSILEGVSAGLPMVTWPIFAEQFYNEKLVTQVLKVGTSVGNKVWKAWATEETHLIGRDKIKTAVDIVMGGGEEAERMRMKASELGELANKAVKEGGSSYNNIKDLVRGIKSQSQK